MLNHARHSDDIAYGTFSAKAFSQYRLSGFVMGYTASFHATGALRNKPFPRHLCYLKTLDETIRNTHSSTITISATTIALFIL
jgi:hypothetical protein